MHEITADDGAKANLNFSTLKSKEHCDVGADAAASSLDDPETSQSDIRVMSICRMNGSPFNQATGSVCSIWQVPDRGRMPKIQEIMHLMSGVWNGKGCKLPDRWLHDIRCQVGMFRDVKQRYPR
jgi:hypothetical protein